MRMINFEILEVGGYLNFETSLLNDFISEYNLWPLWTLILYCSLLLGRGELRVLADRTISFRLHFLWSC